METARLTEQLLIKTISVSATTAGEPIEIYKPLYRIYASITTQRGNMGFDDNTGKSYSDTISFYCRYNKLDKKSVIIEYNCEDYEIVNITHIRKTATRIECRSIK